MSILRYCLIVAVALLSCAPTWARKIRKSKQTASLIEAYSQRTVPGIQGAPIQTNTHFIICWLSADHPQTFFWHSANATVLCGATKARKTVKQSRFHQQTTEYMLLSTDMTAVHAGDTLSVTPDTQKKQQKPSGLPSSPVNSLIYRSSKGGWNILPVKQIIKKPDVMMP
jgi:hypothetical protein